MRLLTTFLYAICALPTLALNAGIFPAARERHAPVCMVGSQRASPKERAGKITYIDGDNLMSQRKVTRGREELAAKLTGVRNAEVVLVWDGRPGEVESIKGSDPQVVITRGADDATGIMRERADEWIAREISEGRGAAEFGEVEVVTADRGLRSIAQYHKAKTINPVK